MVRAIIFLCVDLNIRILEPFGQNAHPDFLAENYFVDSGADVLIANPCPRFPHGIESDRSNISNAYEYHAGKH